MGMTHPELLAGHWTLDRKWRSAGRWKMLWPKQGDGAIRFRRNMMEKVMKYHHCTEEEALLIEPALMHGGVMVLDSPTRYLRTRQLRINKGVAARR